MSAVRRDDSERVAVHADEACDLICPPERPDLEERIHVGQQADGPPHVECGGSLARNEVEELLLSAIGWVARVR